MRTNIDPWLDSIEPLAELIHDNTLLSPVQATKVARAILSLTDDNDEEIDE